MALLRMEARFKKEIPIFGLQAQVLGYARMCTFDPQSGLLTHIILRTEWQPIEIEWAHLEFDQEQKTLRLKPQDKLQVPA